MYYAGIDTDVQGKHDWSRFIPSGSDRLPIGLFERYLLRRTGYTGLADTQHPRRLLVGHHHHDDIGCYDNRKKHRE